MRLARFQGRGGTAGFGTAGFGTAGFGTAGFGVVEGETVVDLSGRVARFEDLLAGPVELRPDDPRRAVADVAWAPPIGTHAKIFCVGLNYAGHIRETGRELPLHPVLFTRYPDSLVGSGSPVVRPPESDELDWEGEVAVVIGVPTRRVPAADAPAHVAGVTVMAENSVRDWQRHSGQATAGKNWEASGACGPWLVTADEVGAAPLTLTTRVDGEVVQRGDTGDLVFPVADLVAYVSTFTTLRPGDVIATGTPGGVGFTREPPRFLQPGQTVEVEVSRVGTLRHGVVGARVPVGSPL